MSAYSRTELEQLRVVDLQELLRKQHQKVSGRKAELIDRLLGVEPALAPQSPPRSPPRVPPKHRSPPAQSISKVIPPEIGALLSKMQKQFLTPAEGRKLIGALHEGLPIRQLKINWDLTPNDFKRLATGIERTTTLKDLELNYDSHKLKLPEASALITAALHANRSIEVVTVGMFVPGLDLALVSPVLKELIFREKNFKIGTNAQEGFASATSLEVLEAPHAGSIKILTQLVPLLRVAPQLQEVNLSHSVYTDASIQMAVQLVLDNPSITHLNLSVASYWYNRDLNQATHPISLETAARIVAMIEQSPQLNHLDLSDIKMTAEAAAMIEAAVAARPEIVYNETRRQLNLEREVQRAARLG